MKILHLTSHDHGGAGRAAVRLHQALLKYGIDSQMIVQHKNTDFDTIHLVPQGKIQKFFMLLRTILDQSLTNFLYKKKIKDIFSSTLFPRNRVLLKKIKEINPDIIHLHWINAGFINVLDLLEIGKPILWSLHDANPYTGGCHVVCRDCNNYKTFCHACPFLGSSFKYDLSYFNFRRKQKVYKNLNLTINGLSKWIASEAKTSTLLKDKTVINLPNTIDTNIFRPIEKKLAREILNIGNFENQKYLIGFGAISGTTIERKGYSQLKEALESLPNKHLYKLLVFGSSQGEEIAGIETVFLGHLYDDVALKTMYSSIDITIVPSLSESFGQVALESLACGTPVICFDSTGLKDIIIHKQNGYLAQSFLPQDLARGIQWFLSLAPAELDRIKNNAINTANKFNYQAISAKYIKEYSKLSINKMDRGGGIKSY